MERLPNYDYWRLAEPELVDACPHCEGDGCRECYPDYDRDDDEDY